MGNTVRRVPLDFEWPLNKPWQGFLTPKSLHEGKCDTCDGTGYSADARLLHDLWYGYVAFDPAETGSTRLTVETPAVRARAERNAASSPEFYGDGEIAIVREAHRLAELWNGMWSHHLDQDDVNALIEGGRLYDFTHTWVKGRGWEPIFPTPEVTAEQVNTWSLGGFGHDSINCHVVISAKCQRLGVPELCQACEGHGSTEKYEGQRAEAEAWKPTEPPAGDGWQLWETVSEGSPVSPVFATADELATWMSDPERGDRWVPASVAAQFIADGWAPSGFITESTGVVSGVEFVGMRDSHEGGGDTRA